METAFTEKEKYSNDKTSSEVQNHQNLIKIRSEKVEVLLGMNFVPENTDLCLKRKFLKRLKFLFDLNINMNF